MPGAPGMLSIDLRFLQRHHLRARSTEDLFDAFAASAIRLSFGGFSTSTLSLLSYMSLLLQGRRRRGGSPPRLRAGGADEESSASNLSLFEDQDSIRFSAWRIRDPGPGPPGSNPVGFVAVMHWISKVCVFRVRLLDGGDSRLASSSRNVFPPTSDSRPRDTRAQNHRAVAQHVDEDVDRGGGQTGLVDMGRWRALHQRDMRGR